MGWPSGGDHCDVVTLLGLLPLLGTLALGTGLGVLATWAPTRLRRATYAAPWVLATITLALSALSPPCTDLLDGPSELIWVSDAAYLTLALTALAAVAAAASALSSLARAHLRRRRASSAH